MLMKIKRILSSAKNLLVTRNHLHAELKKSIRYMDTVLNQQQALLEKLSTENGMLTKRVQQMQRQSFISSIMLLRCTSVQTAEQTAYWDLLKNQYLYEDHPLAFLKICYLLRDTLTETNNMNLMRQEYVNTVLDICLSRLDSEDDPETKQLIYDALKNEVFDDLELVGYNESFYYDKTAYRKMREIVERKYDYNYLSVLSKPFYEKALIKWYREKTGGELNLENPVTYNDKINWLKLNEHDQRKTRLADKYEVRQYVAETIGPQYLIPLINVWENPDDIDFSELPESFVLKATHGSGWNIIVPDKAALNIPDAVKRMKKWMGLKLSYCNGLELHYIGIKPRIIAEQYLENSGGDLNDYKVWCFGGKAHFIQYLAERQHGLKMACFDLDWNKLPFISTREQLTDTVEKPENLEELITIAEKLAAGFNHVRVDFYRLNSGVWKFGEMTFTPGGGKLIWTPPEYNKIVGDLFELN